MRNYARNNQFVACVIYRLWPYVCIHVYIYGHLIYSFKLAKCVTAKLCKNMRDLLMRPSHPLAEQVRHCDVPKSQHIAKCKRIMGAAIDILSVRPFGEAFANAFITRHRQLCVAIDLGRIVSFNHLELHIKRKPIGLFWCVYGCVCTNKIWWHRC